ncbi:MAG: response regulator [bacterium]
MRRRKIPATGKGAGVKQTSRPVRVSRGGVLGKSKGGGTPARPQPVAPRATPPHADGKSWCHSVVYSIRDAVIVTEKTGAVLFLNPAAEKLTGWTLEATMGRPLSAIFKAAGEDSGKPVSLPFAKLSRRQPADIPERLLLSTRGGARKHVQSSISPLSDADGEIMGVVLVLRDVTEHYLMARRAVTRQKIEAVGALAQGIAHDFGLLIGKIDSNASVLEDSLIPGTNSHAAARKILDSTREARELTSHLSELAQASELRSRSTTSPVSAIQVIADSARVLEKMFAEKHIAFVSEAQGTFPLVQANPAQLLDALIGVFLNSIEAMPDGGTLTVRITQKHFSRHEHKLNPEAKTGRYGVISVTDTGLGMSRETLSHIFDPFFTTKPPGIVKGLGLTIIQATVLSWGGWISVKSAQGKGTTVSLNIPAAEVSGPPAAVVSPEEKTILVIDDSEADLATLKAMLEERGHTVHTATNGTDGLTMLHERAGEIDLVVVDLIMPSLDGGEVFRRIIEQNPSANVIMASGFSRDYARTHIGMGGWGFVQKPIEKEQLLHAVSRALEQPMIPETETDTARKGSGTDAG